MEETLNINLSEYSQRKRKNITYIVNENNCWECNSHSKHVFGYPQITYRRKDGVRTTETIARLSYMSVNGEIPKGKVMRHTCDNPLCINPNHLIPGTQLENNRDRINRGRTITPSMVGLKNPNVILNEEQVREIIKSTECTKDLMVKYKVAQTTISNIKLNKSWKHINREC